LDAYLTWAAWMRGHAGDPSWQPDVIRHREGANEMRWEGWADWQAGDPRWRVRVIDTSDTPAAQVAEELVAWVEAERTLFYAGRHPLVALSGG
jgi:hypothetical protein